MNNEPPNSPLIATEKASSSRVRRSLRFKLRWFDGSVPIQQIIREIRGYL